MKLYLHYLKIHLLSQMQYKMSFFLIMLSQMLVSFSSFIAIYFLMRRFNKVDDFSMNEILLCFAVITISFSIAECFMRGFDHFSKIISNGEFDRILVRPRNILLQVLGSKVEFSKIGRFIQSAVVFIAVIPKCGVDWNIARVITLILMILCGAMVFGGLFIIFASLCFFTTDGLEFMNILTDGGRQFGSYPLSIYGKGVLRFCTYVVPLALCQYYPMLYLTGRSTNVLHMLAPLFSILFLIPCVLLWNIGLRHYKSTGS